jgi:hypothetical protein
MSSIYGRLGFNTSDATTQAAVTPYNSSVQTQMSLSPTLLPNQWQVDAVASNTVTGFFQNPVANITQSIWNVSNTLIVMANNLTSTVSSTITTEMANVFASATSISRTAANNYLYVTNRESNVIPPNSDTQNPHYKAAIAQGKILSYLTNQTDNVQNNSVIMGNFTSITLGNTLTSLYNTMNTVTNYLATTITYAYPITSNTTTIDPTNAALLTSAVYQINNLMTVYPAQDAAFFQNSRNVVSDFTTVSQFSNMGQSENYLITNYIGTPTLVSNLNS